MEPAGGIQKHDVVAVGSGVFDAGLGDLHRVAQSLLEHRHAQLSAHDLQLLDGGGTEGVAGHQKGPLAVLLFHIAGSLAPLVVLPAPLRPTSITTVGGLEEMVSLALSPPIRAVSSSLTILTII